MSSSKFVHECSTEIEKRAVRNCMLLLINEILVPVVIETYKTFVRTKVDNIEFFFARGNCTITVKEVLNATMVQLREHLTATAPTQVERMISNIIAQMTLLPSKAEVLACCEVFAGVILRDIEITPDKMKTNSVTREYILQQIATIANDNTDFIHICYELLAENIAPRYEIFIS